MAKAAACEVCRGSRHETGAGRGADRIEINPQGRIVDFGDGN